MSERGVFGTVRDLMQTDLVTVARGTTVGELMRILAKHSISGVPVVDDSGSVLGVVSAADVMTLAEWPEAVRADVWRPYEHALDEQEGAEPDGPVVPGAAGAGYFSAPDGPLWHFPLSRLPLMNARLETTRVEEVMTPATFRVRPDATLPELARFLVRAKIHRALVFEGSRLQGIVTSMDVLRAVASGELR